MRSILTILALLVLLALGYTAYQVKMHQLNNPPASPTPSLLTTEVALDSPKPSEKVSSPLVVDGHAKASWFADGKTSISIVDSKGAVLGSDFIYSGGEPGNSLAFIGTVTFSTPTTATGNIVIKKSDGQSEVLIPITFTDGQN